MIFSAWDSYPPKKTCWKLSHLFFWTEKIKAIYCFVIFGKVHLVRHGISRYESQVTLKRTGFSSCEDLPSSPREEQTPCAQYMSLYGIPQKVAGLLNEATSKTH